MSFLFELLSLHILIKMSRQQRVNFPRMPDYSRLISLENFEDQILPVDNVDKINYESGVDSGHIAGKKCTWTYPPDVFSGKRLIWREVTQHGTIIQTDIYSKMGRTDELGLYSQDKIVTLFRDTSLHEGNVQWSVWYDNNQKIAEGGIQGKNVKIGVWTYYFLDGTCQTHDFGCRQVLVGIKTEGNLLT